MSNDKENGFKESNNFLATVDSLEKLLKSPVAACKGALEASQQGGGYGEYYEGLADFFYFDYMLPDITKARKLAYKEEYDTSKGNEDNEANEDSRSGGDQENLVTSQEFSLEQASKVRGPMSKCAFEVAYSTF